MGQYIENEHIIEELNKQRGVQKELLARRGYLTEYLEISNRDYEANEQRIKEVDEKIKDLRGKL